MGMTLRIRNLLLAAVAAGVLAPATAQAAAPLTADYTAADISPTNHQWYVTGTTTTASTLATNGTVTFRYLTGTPPTTRHDVIFAATSPKPTECTPALSAGG